MFENQVNTSVLGLNTFKKGGGAGVTKGDCQYVYPVVSCSNLFTWGKCYSRNAAERILGHVNN